MKRTRDMDLIRSLMMEIEEGANQFAPDYQTPSNSAGSYEEVRERINAVSVDWEVTQRHLTLIEEAGYVEFSTVGVHGYWAVVRITGKGHDFLDSVRDPAIWAKTKDGARAAGGFTLDLLGALAKGFLKKQIQDRTGIEVEL